MPEYGSFLWGHEWNRHDAEVAAMQEMFKPVAPPGRTMVALPMMPLSRREELAIKLRRFRGRIHL